MGIRDKKIASQRYLEKSTSNLRRNSRTSPDRLTLAFFRPNMIQFIINLVVTKSSSSQTNPIRK